MDSHHERSFFKRAPEALHLCRLAVWLAWRAQPLLGSLLLLLFAVQAALPPLLLWFTQALVDRLTFDLGLTAQASDVVRLLPLGAWIGLAAAAVALSQFLQPLSATFQVMVDDRITGFVGRELIRVANSWQGLARFENPQFADDLAHTRRYVSGGGIDIMRTGEFAALSLLTAIGMAVLLAALHPLVPIVLVLLTLPAIGQRWDFSDRMGSHLYCADP